jgi:hypothetical protein
MKDSTLTVWMGLTSPVWLLRQRHQWQGRLAGAPVALRDMVAPTLLSFFIPNKCNTLEPEKNIN